MSRNSDDDGLSMVELIVYVLVLSILLSVITAVFVNTWKAQASVTAQTAATTRGQLVSSQIERAMRNAIAFSISADGTTLRVNTSFPADRQCQNFSMTADGLRMSVSASPSPATWPVWQPDVSVIGSTAAFAPAGTSGINYSFETRGGSTAVKFQGSVHMRNATTGVMGGC